jgi:beta-mannosidase
VLRPYAGWSENVEALLGRFVDVSWAYRFGPPGQDLIAFALEDGEGRPLARAFRQPTGRAASAVAETADRLGLEGTLRALGPDSADVALALRARRFVDGVRVHVEGYLPDDDAFALEPGREHVIRLRPDAGGPGGLPRGHLTALNLAGRLALDVEAQS